MEKNGIPKNSETKVSNKFFLKKYLKYLVAFLVICVGFVIFIFYSKISEKKEVHYHAGFVVFKDDKKIDFSDFKFMRVKPCLVDKSNHEESPEDIQSEKAHLHDNVGDVVHIEGVGATWKDLFTNIKYDLDYNFAKVYINGKEVNDFKNRSIQPDDSAVILIGKNKSDHLKDAVSRSYIEEKAANSVDCGE